MLYFFALFKPVIGWLSLKYTFRNDTYLKMINNKNQISHEKFKRLIRTPTQGFI